MCEKFTKRYGIKIKCTFSVNDAVGWDDKDIHIYRIIQEALINVVKHAYATEVTIEATVKNDNCTFIIRDNGRGIEQLDKKGYNEKISSLGLDIMNERVTLLDGMITIDSQKDKGTVLNITIPFKKAAHGKNNGKIPHYTG